MDATTPLRTLARLDLTSIPLVAPGTLPVQLAGWLQLLADDLPYLPARVRDLLGDLDRKLVGDPFAGAATFVADAPDEIGMVDRLALIALAGRCGAVLDLPATLDVPGPLPAKRRQTLLETLLVRIVAVDHRPSLVCAIGGLEAGAAAVELANTTADSLRRHDDGSWVIAVPGSRDADPRDVAMPGWCAPAATALAARPLGGDWLLHTSRSASRDARTSTLLMSTRTVLTDAAVAPLEPVSAESIRRTAMTRLATTAGPDGWALAVAAVGHRNPGVTDRLLRLADRW